LIKLHLWQLEIVTGNNPPRIGNGSENDFFLNKVSEQCVDGGGMYRTNGYLNAPSGFRPINSSLQVA